MFVTRLIRATLVLIALGWAALPVFATTTTPSPVPPTPQPTVEATPEITPEATIDPLAPVPAYIPVVQASFPHDTDAFTQGLVWDNGALYESTGRYGLSTLRQVDLETGEVLRSVPLDETFFAEGLALIDDLLIQITWQEGVAFVYDKATFDVIGQYEYEGEGWGLCYDGAWLWMTDGTANLFRRDPVTFELLETIPVTLFGEPIPQLNEIECVDPDSEISGDEVIFANIWQTDFIVIIAPDSGLIVGVIDASDLLTDAQRATLEGGAVLNGIAYRPETGTFLITGKLWPLLFEVTFEEVGALQPRTN